ncbi:MAG: hypothetical protein H0T73_07805 [Ardenticatenales bacterium]|nr:hypothetical protein [Ardenticatenales bacterium]
MSRAVDMLVAEALGWSLAPGVKESHEGEMLNPVQQHDIVPAYSTDWMEASVLLQEMALSFEGCSLEYMRDGRGWLARWRFKMKTNRSAKAGDRVVTYADTPTLAIAIAYARHKGMDEERVQAVLNQLAPEG